MPSTPSPMSTPPRPASRPSSTCRSSAARARFGDSKRNNTEDNMALNAYASTIRSPSSPAPAVASGAASHRLRRGRRHGRLQRPHQERDRRHCRRDHRQGRQRHRDHRRRDEEVGPAAPCRRTFASFGRIDIVVNNAGGNEYRPFLEISEDEFKFHFDWNTTSAFLLSQIVTPHMVRPGRGAILNISSGAGHIGIRGMMSYCVAKAALDHLTSRWPRSWRPRSGSTRWPWARS